VPTSRVVGTCSGGYSLRRGRPKRIGNRRGRNSIPADQFTCRTHRARPRPGAPGHGRRDAALGLGREQDPAAAIAQIGDRAGRIGDLRRSRLSLRAMRPMLTGSDTDEHAPDRRSIVAHLGRLLQSREKKTSESSNRRSASCAWSREQVQPAPIAMRRDSRCGATRTSATSRRSRSRRCSAQHTRSITSRARSRPRTSR